LQQVPEKALEVIESSKEPVQLAREGEGESFEVLLEALKADMVANGTDVTPKPHKDVVEKEVVKTENAEVVRKGYPVMIRVSGHEYPAVAASVSADGKKVDLQFWYGAVKPKVAGVPSKFIFRAKSGKKVFEDMKVLGQDRENAEKIVRLAEALAKVGSMSTREKSAFQEKNASHDDTKDVLPMETKAAARKAAAKAKTDAKAARDAKKAKKSAEAKIAAAKKAKAAKA